MENDMEKESWSITPVESTKATGSAILSMEKAMKNFKMGLFTRDSSSMVNLKGWVVCSGLMASFTKASGLLVLNMVLVCGMELKETATLVNGNSGKPMATEYMYGLMEIDMKDNLNKI